MGGLSGEFRWRNPHQLQPLAPLGHTATHTESTWLSHDGLCRLGKTRSAIHDFSPAGAQPITSHCGRFTLVFNGEIYNHQAVRSGLRFQHWSGHSDNETLVEGLAQRGPALLLDLRGMFAFAAYDAHKQQLLLARDRLGIKPLYLSWHEGGLRFASQRRALPGGDQLDPEAIAQVLAWGHLSSTVEFPTPECGGVRSLPAGLVVRINRERPHDPVRYWPPQPRPDWSPLPIRNVRRARAFLREQLEQAVEQHLLADVPVATFLSAGLHSGLLTALARRAQSARVSSFTVVFPGSPADESALARRMARHCGSEHHELHLSEDQTLEWAIQGLQALDVPNADSLNTYLVGRAAAAQGVKVALIGFGADELFGGYPSHRIVPWLSALTGFPESLRWPLLRALAPRLSQKLQALPRWDNWHLALALRRRCTDADLSAADLDALSWPQPPPQRITQAWGQISWAELFGTTEPTLLRDADVMSMVCGLELRVPFLDHQIVELALRLPQRYQRHGESLLKTACADLFPQGYLNRSKRDFPLPMAQWMRGPLNGLCRERLQSLQGSGWLNAIWLHQQWQSFEAGQLNWPRAWSLVVLGEFAAREALS